jgi:hypothetical protein
VGVGREPAGHVGGECVGLRVGGWESAVGSRQVGVSGWESACGSRLGAGGTRWRGVGGFGSWRMGVGRWESAGSRRA